VASGTACGRIVATDVSLRLRLTLVTVVVAALALIAANVVVYELVARYLEDRYDERVESVVGPATSILVSPSGLPNHLEDRDDDRDGPRTDLTGAYAELRDADGRLLVAGYLFGDDGSERPDISRDDIRGLDDDPGSTLFFDATAVSNGEEVPYRVRAARTGDGDITVAAIPSTELIDSKQRIIFVQLMVSVGVVIGGLLLTWWLVGVGLRPLRRMGDTAERIAEGDLTQRVEPSGDRTEIERLGSSLNVMLTEIETAFAAKDASEQTLRRFVADASHELRTPLTSIRGYAELLRRGADAVPEERLAAARRIEREAQRLGVLVEDLLLLARLDEGVPVERVPVDAVRLVEDLAADARVVDPERAITVDAPAPLAVLGDRDRLTQVVTNLLANARAYSPAGTSIELRAAAVDGTGRIEVIDHGPGIDPELTPHVFDRFWRADDSRSRDRGGAGLGLAIVAAVVGAHGGQCEAVETPGGGATFRVDLPLARTPG
jgi:two-component system OmpR family sensor kinase